MAFNPLQSYLSGQQAGQQQQVQDISGRLSQSENPMLEPEFQRLVDLDPVRAKQIMDVAAGGDAMRTNAMIKDAKTAKYLLSSGDVNGAASLLQNRLQALGDRAGEDTIAVYQDVINGQPDQALSKIDSFLNIFDPNAKKAANQGQGTADIQNYNKLEELKKTGTPEQVAGFSKMLGLTKDPAMSSALEKQIVKAQDDFFQFAEQARQMNVLANDIQARDIGGGLQSTLSETFKSILGSTEEVTALRQRFNAIRTSQATSNLPPGPASDKDIQLALSGFPKENANSATVISFLRGQQKLAKVNEKFAEFKSNFYAVNKSPSGLIPAWKNYAENTKLFDATGDVNTESQGDIDAQIAALEAELGGGQ